MKLVRSCPFVVCLPALLATSTGAQTQRSRPFKVVAQPQRMVELDLATGVYSAGPGARNRGGSTIADFQNLDTFGAGFGGVSVDTAGCSWFNSAAKGAAAHQSQNASDLMTEIIFFYCSNALDPASGGAGGSVTLGFYEGYTVFGGAPTTTAAVVALTGMPGSSAAGSFSSGNAACYGLRVNFPTMIPFADNQFIGYSWEFVSTGTLGLAGDTYPFLSCVVSCSGLNLAVHGTGGGIGGNPLGLGEDGQGMLDQIDRFCPPPANSFSFSLWTPANPVTHTSVNMLITEAADLLTTNTNYNATLTPNPDTLSATKAILGSTWTATLTRGLPSVPGSMFVSVRRGRFPGNGGTPTPPVLGRVLIAGTFFTTYGGPHNGATGTVTAPIPLAFSFCGLHFAAQSRTTGGGIRLSSGVEGTIGTF